MNMKKVLLIDDDVNLCRVLSHQLRKNDFEVRTAHSGQEGLRIFSQWETDVVLCDIQMPGLSGIQVLEEIRRQNREVVVIMITAFGSVDNAIEACHLGADDYITKPFSRQQLLFVIEKALRLRNLEQENVRLHQNLAEKYHFDNMIAPSEIMQNIFRTAGRVAQSDTTVLIQGESGTGKELLARAIHFNSPRKNKPFIVVNCPSIPENLIESELFGHVKGAFTGAVKDRKGKFELADGGTIFLDEIADLGENVQAKLLRVLQEREIERVGGSHPLKVDVRVLAATNKNLEERMSAGKFREDLFYRLNVVPITIPPLRERKGDVPFLVDFFVKKYSKQQQFKVLPEVYEALQNYSWPGNVRELENVIEHIIVLSTEPKISLRNLPGHLFRPPGFRVGNSFSQVREGQSLQEIEREAILRALEQTGGNQSRAAELLKIPRHVLIYRMKKIDIEYKQIKPGSKT